jgi:Ca-activated chloride channel family protein
MPIMTFSPDSPELTAYLLGELDPETRTALEAELHRSPELAAELKSLSKVLGVVSEAFAMEPALGLSPEQHRRVIEALPPASSLPNRVQQPRTETGASNWAVLTRWLGWRGGFLLAGGLAVLATGFFLRMPNHPAPRILADGDRLRYQPDWKPMEMAKAETTDLVSAAPAADRKEAAVPAGPPPVVNAPQPTLSARYGLPPQPGLSTAVPSSAGKSEPKLRFATGGAGTSADALASVPSLATSSLNAQPPTATDRNGGVAVPQSGRYFKEAQLALKPEVTRTLSAGRGGVQLQRSRELEGIAAAAANAAVGDSEAKDSLGRGKVSAESLDLAKTVTVLQRKQYAYQGQKPASATSAMAAFGESGGISGVDHSRRAPLATLGEAPQFSLRFGVPPAESATASTAFAPIQDNPFHPVTTAPLSTFGMDVDTGSYSLIRRMLRENSLPPGDAVRLEELLNYFSYDYPQPKGDHPLGATVEVAACPWNEAHKLVRIGVKAREVANQERPRSNLVFLLDVSGSMAPETRLPLVKRAMRLLIDRLSPRDTVGIVTYAGEARVALEPVAISDEGRRQVTEVLDSLEAGSGTHGSAGIQNAYAMATNHFIPGGVNRVILCTDGDFNVGVTDQNELLSLITARAKSGVFLSVLGFGMDNLKDSTLELLADRGNGNYAYIDSFSEARKVLVKQLDGTLVTVAKDAKIQVEFNPARVSRYRLLGYEKRLLRDRDFNDDTKDAGEVGAGHSVTVLYEIEPVGGTGAGVDPLRYAATPAAAPESRVRTVHGEELLNLKIRYKQPDGQTSRLMEMPVKDMDRDLAKASVDFKFAASVAGYGMLLRQSPHAGTLTWEQVLRLAEQGQGNDVDGYRAEFIDLARRAQALRGQP